MSNNNFKMSKAKAKDIYGIKQLRTDVIVKNQRASYWNYLGSFKLENIFKIQGQEMQLN
jgi:predicted GNAT family N-acyltransferase